MLTLSVCLGLVREEIGITEGSAWRGTDLRLINEPKRKHGDGERCLIDKGVVDALVVEEAR
uniref:Uncharacterized protein n=1 Tax=Zea mays TaxID=4577 RepID=B7ZZG5_MAIZE|nr:unknown [Zea mays]